MIPFDQLVIDGFGIFHNLVLRLGPGLNVLLGDNEAGKSTLLAFIRALLFGLPRGTRANTYPPLSGGSHGGRLVLRRGKEKIVVERLARRKKKEVLRLWRGDEEVEEAKATLRELFGGLPEVVYNNVIGFSLDELQNLGSLKDDQIKGFIYGASGGVDAKALARLEHLFDHEKSAAAGTPKRAFRDAFNKTRKLHGQIKEAANDVTTYDSIDSEFETLEASVRERQKELERLGEQGHRLQAHCDALDAWHGVQRLRGKLSQMPEFPDFPQGGVEKLDGFVRELDEKAAHLKAKQEQHQETERSLADCPVDEELLAKASKLERLNRGRNAYAEALRKKDTLGRDLMHLKEKCDRAFKLLGKGWDEERVRRVDLSQVRRDELEDFRGRFGDADEKLRRAGNAERQEQRLLQDKRESSESHRDRAKEVLQNSSLPDEKSRVELRAAWQNYRSHADQHEREGGELEELKARCDRALRETGNEVSAEGLGTLLEKAAQVRKAAGVEEKLRQRRELMREQLPPESEKESTESRHALEHRLVSVRRCRRLLPEAQSAVLKWLPIGLAGGCFLGALALAVRQDWLGLVFAAAIGLGLVSYFLLQQRAGAQRRRKLEAAAPSLGLSGTVDEAALHGLEQELDAKLRQLDRIESHRELRQTLLDRLKKLDREHAEFLKQWRKFLSSIGLDPSLAPARALELLDQAAGLASLMDQVAATEAKVKLLSRNMSTFQSRFEEQLGGLEGTLAERVELLLSRWDRCERELEQADTAAAEAKKLLEKLERLRGNTARAQKEKEQLEAEWKGWLTHHGYPAECRSETARDYFTRVEGLLVLLDDRRKKREDLERVEAQVLAHESSVNEVLSALRREPATSEDMMPAVDGLWEELKGNREFRTNRQQLEKTLQGLATEVREASMNLTKAEERQAKLLRGGGAADEEDFRRRAAQHASRVAVQDELERKTDAVLSRLGLRGIDEAEKELKGVNRESVKVDLEKVEWNIGELKRRIDQDTRELGRLKELRSSLRSSRELVELQRQQQDAADEARSKALEWAALKVGSAILAAAREKYEKELQPGVIQEAGKYVSVFTRGRYTRISAPIGEDRFELVGADEARRELKQLSRATAEQLYLALRFGFVLELDKGKDLPPIVMDDILANFDPHRRNAACAAVAELAQNHQLLYFTCHPRLAELLCKSGKEVRAMTVQQNSKLVDGLQYEIE